MDWMFTITFDQVVMAAIVCLTLREIALIAAPSLVRSQDD